MFDLFRQYPIGNVGGAQPPQWAYLKRHTEENIKTYKEYYKHSSLAINAENILIDILYSLAVPMSYEPERYAQAVQDKYPSSAMSLGLISAVSYGRRTKPGFFGRHACELLVALDEPFDAQAAFQDWENITAVTVLSHPFTIFGLPAPFASHDSLERGPIVIAIDVPKLALQFKAFLESQSQDDDTYGAMNFATKYVWPNMMPSYLEQVWFNRLAAGIVGLKPNKHLFFKLPFQMANLNAQLENCEKFVKETMNNMLSNTFEYQLKTIPALFADDMYQALVLPGVASTTQVSWAMDLARLKHLTYLTLVNDGRSCGPSREELQQAITSLVHNYAVRYMQQHLPQELFLQQDYYINQITYRYRN